MCVFVWARATVGFSLRSLWFIEVKDSSPSPAPCSRPIMNMERAVEGERERRRGKLTKTERENGTLLHSYNLFDIFVWSNDDFQLILPANHKNKTIPSILLLLYLWSLWCICSWRQKTLADVDFCWQWNQERRVPRKPENPALSQCFHSI